MPTVLGAKHAAHLGSCQPVPEWCSAAVLQRQAGDWLGISRLVLGHLSSVARPPDLRGPLASCPTRPRNEKQEPRYYMARLGRGSKKPKSLSEWNRRVKPGDVVGDGYRVIFGSVRR
jgi:hypothetical protein